MFSLMLPFLYIAEMTAMRSGLACESEPIFVSFMPHITQTGRSKICFAYLTTSSPHFGAFGFVGLAKTEPKAT